MSKKDPQERQDHHGRKLDPGDYDSLISQHSIFEAATRTMKQHNFGDLPGFSGYSNAETQTKPSDIRGSDIRGRDASSAQTNLGAWPYNPWWMLASTSRATQADYDSNDGPKVKEEPGGAASPDPDPLGDREMEQYADTPRGPQPPISVSISTMDAFCDDCSDPFCDSSSAICRKLFHCPHCRKSYPTILEFNTHLTGVHPAQKPFRCQICLEPFDKKSQLRRHLDGNHTRKDVNKCSVCSKYIKDKSNLRKHMQVHTGRVPQKQFKCDLCNNKRYMSLDRLNNHRVVCTGEKVLKYCDMCSKVFDNSRSLNSHKKVHARELKCEPCGEQFRSLEHLTNHRVACRGQGGSGSQDGGGVPRCCSQPGLCEHDKPAYLNIPGYATSRALDATLTSLKSQLN